MCFSLHTFDFTYILFVGLNIHASTSVKLEYQLLVIGELITLTPATD